MVIIYLIVSFFATFFGALAGLGGGVIIKPLLDLMNQFDAMTISALASTAVFSMAIVTLFSNVKKGISVHYNLWFIAVGAALGGYFGKVFFAVFLKQVGDDYVAKGIQALILGILMLGVFFLTGRDYKVNLSMRSIGFVIIGVTLGIVSSFLGIGGGPINVFVLIVLCGFERKYAVFGSIFLIFASQGVKISTLLLQHQFHLFNLDALVGLILGGVLGGYYGGKLYRRISADIIISIFKAALLVIALVDFFSAYRFFFIA